MSSSSIRRPEVNSLLVIAKIFQFPEALEANATSGRNVVVLNVAQSAKNIKQVSEERKVNQLESLTVTATIFGESFKFVIKALVSLS